MYIKKNLMKAASVCLYVFSFLWFVAAACAFGLSNYIYWLFLVFALISLYDSFVITSVRQKMTNVVLDKKERIKYLVCWILSIVSIPAFVLNAIAFFHNKEDGYELVKHEIPQTEAGSGGDVPKSPKPFYKANVFITMCVSFVLIFILGFSGMAFETSGFSVTVSDFTLTREMTLAYNNGEIHGEQYVLENDTSYAVTMYVPDSATEENPAPTVFVVPGFTRTKATMAQYCIELSRRGAVVFCIDPGGQGGTTETSTSGANGVEYLVQYVYNNTDDFRFCDKDKFGAVGHSAGGGNAITLASDMSGNSYEESIIKAVYNSGYIRVSAANRFQNLNCNAAMSYAYYDEGSFRFQTDTSAFEVIALRFINEVGGNVLDYETISYDYGYGDMSNGTYRIVHRENINHCFEMYDTTSIANLIDFFDEALELNSGISGTSQIWLGKEISNGLALAAAFTFIISLCAVLMKIPFFAKMKKDNAKNTGFGGEDAVPVGESSAVIAEGAPAGVVCDAETEERPMRSAAAGSLAAVQAKPKTVTHRIVFWSTMILTAIIACLDYIPLANLSIEIFPVGNSSSVYTFVYPARMINAILLWALINGAIGLVLFFATTLIENLYIYGRSRAEGIAAVLDWSKFRPIKIGGKNAGGVVINVLKMLLLAVILYGVFYFMVQLSYWIFHQDFRFMLISAAPLNARMFITALEYIPVIFVFYISNSIRVNCSIGKEGWSEWKVMLVGALANSLGLAFILLINYVCYFVTGSPYYGYWGNGTEVWLYVNMVFGLVVMMFILPIFNRLFYKITGNVWLGAIVCCAIFITMTISASVSYIPM